jgi:subtilase family serine protease
VKRIAGSGRAQYRVGGFLRVKNSGAEPARATNAELTLFPFGERDRYGLNERAVPIPALAPGASRRLRVSLVLPGPQRRSRLELRTVLDAASRLLEPNETNNYLDVTLGGN